jgi:hypothetical protein
MSNSLLENDFKSIKDPATGSLLRALRARNFKVFYAPDRASAKQLILDLIPQDVKVGTGDSTAVRQLGVMEALQARGTTVYDGHKRGVLPEQAREFAKLSYRWDTEFFLTGTNAVTQDGRLLNVDAGGNRVVGMFYGHQQSVLVISRNKVVKDLAAAFDRVRNQISPQHIKIRSQDLGGKPRNTPCDKTAVCHDCRGKERTCNIFTILEGGPKRQIVNIVYVDDDLGLAWDEAWPKERIQAVIDDYKEHVWLPNGNWAAPAEEPQDPIDYASIPDPVVVKTLKALKGRNFKVHYAKDRHAARELMLKIIPQGVKVGTGDSTAARQTGIHEALAARGTVVYDGHKRGVPMGQNSRLSELSHSMDTEFFLTGSNALTEDGKLVNIDAVGNRVEGMFYGHKASVLVLSRNKIVKDLDAALARIRGQISPQHVKIRSQDLGGRPRNTPCDKTGVCQDCRGKERTCNVFTILEGAPRSIKIHVVFVDEDLGLAWDENWPQERIQAIIDGYKELVWLPGGGPAIPAKAS